METKKPKNILVTGGGGFLGKAIIVQLKEKGHTITSFSRNHYPALADLGVEQISGDITDAEAVKRAAVGRDVVFHTAARAGVWGPDAEYYATNVTGTQNVIAACKTGHVPTLIHTSSPSVIFDGGDMEGVDESFPYPKRYHAPYPETKAAAERLVMAATDEKLATILLRPHLIWGPEDPHLAPRLLKRAKSLKRVGSGANRVDTTYIDNAARAHVLAMEALDRNPVLSGRVYFISDDDPIELWTMIDRILAAGGKPPVTGRVSPKVAYFLGVVLEWVFGTLHISKEPKMTRFLAGELATSHWFDITAAKRDLGYSAAISIDEGMKRLADWLTKTEMASVDAMSISNKNDNGRQKGE